MTTELDAALQAARAAGNLLRENYYKPHQVEYKGADNIVTEMDRRCEQLIAEMLLGAFPDYGVYGEEATRTNPNARRRWIVDPLDGTTSYSRGYPLFAVSIGLEEAGEAVVGAIYNPLLDEMFSAETGKGAWLNGSPIHVSEVDTLGKALLASGFPYGVWDRADDNLAEYARLTKVCMQVRCDGSAAIDMCHTAIGRLDGYWEIEVEAWDMAAGAVILKEAGGRITRVNGQPFDLFGRNVLVSNGRLHDELLHYLKDNGKEE